MEKITFIVTFNCLISEACRCTLPTYFVYLEVWDCALNMSSYTVEIMLRG